MAYKDPDKQREFQRLWMRKRYARQKEAKDSLKDKCIHCGETEKCCLDFHHLDPSTKSFSIGGTMNGTKVRLPKDIIEESKKCVVLCRNCHAKVHAGVISIDIDKSKSE